MWLQVSKRFSSEVGLELLRMCGSKDVSKLILKKKFEIFFI